MDKTNKYLSEFGKFIEDNQLTVLYLTHQKNVFFSNNVFTNEQLDFEKVLHNFNIFADIFKKLLETNKNFVYNIVNLFEYLGNINMIKRDYQKSFMSYENSAKFRERYIPQDMQPRFILNRLMNCYNRVECLILDSKNYCTIPNNNAQMEECKRILESFDLRFIQTFSFLDRLLYYFYGAQVNFFLNRLADFDKLLNIFKQDLLLSSQQQLREKLPVENLKEFIEMRFSLLEVRFLEKGNVNRINEILGICEQLRGQYININTEFSIKVSLKVADTCFAVKDLNKCSKYLLSVVTLLKSFKAYPKVFKVKYRLLIYSKLATLNLFLRKYKEYKFYLQKFNKNADAVRKLNIQIPGNGFNLVHFALANNNAIYELRQGNYKECELALTKVKESIYEGPRVDPAILFAINNNIACVKFQLQNYTPDVLNSLYDNYKQVQNYPNIEQYSIALNNICIGAKTLHLKNWIQINPGDELAKALETYKDKINEIYNRSGYRIGGIYEVNNLIYIYNFIMIALNQNKDGNQNTLSKIVDLANFTARIQEGEYKESIWVGWGSLILNLVYSRALIWFFKGDFKTALQEINLLDELSIYIDLNHVVNIQPYFNLVKLKGDIMYKIKKHCEAIEEYKIALGVYEKLPFPKQGTKAAILFNIGLCSLNVGSISNFIANLEQARDIYINEKSSYDKIERIKAILAKVGK